MAGRGNGGGAKRRGRPPKPKPATEGFTDQNLRKHIGVWRTMKRGSQEANTRLSEHVKAAIDQGAPRKGLRMLYQLLQMDYGEAQAVLDWLTWAFEHTADDRQGDIELEARRRARDDDSSDLAGQQAAGMA